jgi:hypothetical protein
MSFWVENSTGVTTGPFLAMWVFWQYRPTIIVAVVCAEVNYDQRADGRPAAHGRDAVVSGYSLTSPGGLDQIRRTMGVCPQFIMERGSLVVSICSSSVASKA